MGSAKLFNRLGLLRNTEIPQVKDPALLQNDHFRGSSKDQQLGLERRKGKKKKKQKRKENLIKCK